MQRFARYPLLRLLLPFISGILLYLFFSENLRSFTVFQQFLLALSLLIVLAILLIIQLYKNIHLIITFFIDIALIIFGYELCYFQDLRNYDTSVNHHLVENFHQQILVKPCDIIVHKENFSRLVVESHTLFDTQKRTYKTIKGKIMIYFPDELNIDSIFHPNRYYLISAKLKTILPNENPYAFNYSEYLNRQGIYTIANINSLSEIIPLNIKEKWNIQEWTLFVRHKIVEYFKTNIYLSEQAKAIASALLTGFDDEIDNQIIQSFSHSGTIHILSVSGFHTGLLFLMITFIFNLFDPYKKWRWARIITTIFILFFYAFMAGFSPPIVRASIMLSLIVIQQYLYTDRIIHPLNILAAAAFFVLLYNPFFIDDIGFLLSFSAMIGIIYFSPKYIFENQIVQSIWDIASMSIGAQIGTLPFVLYFFHSFSFLFILSNLLIVPLTTIIMFIAILALFPVPFFSVILNTLINWLITLNTLFDKNYFYYNWFHFTWFDAIILSLIIVVSRVIFQKIVDKEWHWIKMVQWVLVVSTFWILAHWMISVKENKQQKFALYVEKNKPYYWIEKDQHIYFNFLDSTALERWGKNLLLKKCIDKYSDFAFNYVQFKNKNILIIKEWKDTMLLKSTQPNVIIWCIKKMPSKSLIPESTKKVYCVNGKVINENEKVLVMKNGQYIEFE